MMKAAIKDAYIAKLQQHYPTLYLPGSRPLDLAVMAADQALRGQLALRGECWSAAVEDVTGLTRWTMADLAGLPE